MPKKPKPLIRHFLYYQGTALNHWFSQRIRPAGYAIIIVTFFSAFLSFGQPKNSIFQIFCLSLSLLTIALVWTSLRSAKISASIKIPKHSTVGEILKYSVKIKNLSRHHLHSALLLQIPPDPRPSLSEFSTSREPNEQSRNPFDRFMAYYRWKWLIDINRSFQYIDSNKYFSIKPTQEQCITNQIIPLHRGVFPLDNLRLLLPDPLGFFQKSRIIPTPHTRLIVLPKRYRLPDIQMPGSATFRIGGEETSNSAGNSGEFVGIRDYRPGDPMRQIHWKGWAHSGKPMVKELEDTFYTRYALILDTFPSQNSPLAFEEMVSIASSFVVSLGSKSEVLLDLIFIANQAHTVTAGRGMERSEKLLEVLASVKIEPNERFMELAKTVSRYREKITSSLLITNGWDQNRKDLYQHIQSSGITCTPIIIGDGPPQPNSPGYWIDSNHTSRDLLALPQVLGMPY